MGTHMKGRATVRRGSITELHLQCIVNATYPALTGKDGVNGTIQKAAGPELQEAFKAMGGMTISEARITSGFHSDADYIIHTIGPFYKGNPEDSRALAACYLNCLDVANANGITQIAFPAISCGANTFPIEKAMPIAVESVRLWLHEHPDVSMHVLFVGIIANVFDAYWHYLYSHPVV
ncbi:MAG: macro domain-containing protein [Eubacteriaceae bacterium]|nr:macro domain-containing protein [Eubacteriaceae bacterium]MDD4508855.1 macro domain-containing protein [Eubacteriaceae bacterium]